MSYSVQKVRELIDYLNGYEQAIEKENCSPISCKIAELLQAISEAQHSGEGCFREAAVAYQIDRTVQYLNAMTIPADACTANRVFNNVIKKGLVAGTRTIAEISPELRVDQSQDFYTQAVGYEALASFSSYDEWFMRHSLLSALYCYLQANEGKDSQDSMRIRSFLDALEIPVSLNGAKKYFFLYLKNANVPFSVSHPRFIEVLQNFCRTINRWQCEDILVRESLKWVERLKV